jgi:hypothetical protein
MFRSRRRTLVRAIATAIGAVTTITTAIGVIVITGPTRIAMATTPRAGTVITVVPATMAAVAPA